MDMTHDVYAHANPIFVREVQAQNGEKIVLDVGCWNGTLGRALMHDPAVIVDGIEKSAEQAAIALSSGYRCVDVADLNRDLPDANGRLYDFILFGDVLEHLMDPGPVLAALSDRLKPDGRVLVSLPNVAFIGTRISHLLGNWNYRDYGILDRTHLRFFTKRTMIELVEAAGFRVTRIEGYVGLSGYPWLVRQPLRHLGRVWPSLFAIQVVLSAEA